jgi:NADPH-dependent curcumin reductase CurA
VVTQGVGQPTDASRLCIAQPNSAGTVGLMKNNRNRQVILKSRPADIPQADNFDVIESDVPDPRDGQILVHNIYLSVEPAMRGWVSSVANYSEPVRIGEVMRSFAAGE